MNHATFRTHTWFALRAALVYLPAAGSLPVTQHGEATDTISAAVLQQCSPSSAYYMQMMFVRVY